MKVTTQLYGEIAVLPFPAEAPLDETLEWLTDVLVSQNGNEDPLQLRTKPRQTYAYSIPVQSWNVAKTFNSAYGALRRLWGVPLWTEAQYVGTITPGNASIDCNTADYSFMDSSLAILWKDESNWEVIEIDKVVSGTLNLSVLTSGIAAAWLMPLRVGYINGALNNRTNGNTGKVTVTFEIEDTLELTPDAPAQYLGDDVYFTPSLLDGSSLEKALTQRSIEFDTELGKVSRRSPWANARYGSNYKTLTTNAAEMRAHKLFLYRRAGRFRRFWMPTFEHHLRLANVGNIASSITIEADGFNDYTFRPHVAVSDLLGNWYARAVSSPTPVIGNRLQLTLDAPINVDASQVANVCYLGKHRFDSDRIELRWIGNSVTESNVRILELTP